MVGITRFNITEKTTGPGRWRFEESQKYWPVANALYREIFIDLEMPLLPGEEIIDCTKGEFQSGYDYQLGIDVVLRPQGQGESTMQEKFLFTDFYTITVEHCQDWLNLEPGDWYKLKAQYYFVGYATKGSLQFNRWRLLDWARLQRATAKRRIPWQLRGNLKDNARASFMYVEFNKLPPDVIVAPTHSLF